ncbi:sel1 repeat family protein [Methylophilaceae bacterium]|nr:sel1 repeat family protein [Methylophilaceae bacterium]
MKNLSLLLLLVVNVSFANDAYKETPVIDKLPKEYALSNYRTQSQLLDKLPMSVVDMVSTFPETLDLVMGCFDYPKIKVLACQEMAKVDHPGSAYAQHNLGIAYAEGGEGLTQSYTEAFYWYLRAANQGLEASQYNLGRMYEYGIGSTPVSHVMAKQLYEKAALQGNHKAKNRFKILILLAINQGVARGEISKDIRLSWIKGYEPWQIEAADKYFE